MNNTLQKSSHSLEMVVSAPITDCVKALHSLQKGDWLTQEKILVNTHVINEEICKFEVTLRIDAGTSRSSSTTFRGVLHADNFYHTTTITGKITSIWRKLLIIGGIGLICFVLFVPQLIMDVRALPSICVLYGIILVPWGLREMIMVNEQNTNYLLKIIENALQMPASNKTNS